MQDTTGWTSNTKEIVLILSTNHHPVVDILHVETEGRRAQCPLSESALENPTQHSQTLVSQQKVQSLVSSCLVNMLRPRGLGQSPRAHLGTENTQAELLAPSLAGFCRVYQPKITGSSVEETGIQRTSRELEKLRLIENLSKFTSACP